MSQIRFGLPVAAETNYLFAVTDTSIKIGLTEPYAGPALLDSTNGQLQRERFDGEKYVRFGDVLRAN